MNTYERLKYFRELFGKSQSDIAKIISTTQQYYGRYENGFRPMPIDRYVILAKYYNISLDYLCGLTDIPKTIDGKQYKCGFYFTINKL